MESVSSANVEIPVTYKVSPKLVALPTFSFFTIPSPPLTWAPPSLKSVESVGSARVVIPATYNVSSNIT